MVAYLDVKKAYDTVWLVRLWRKLGDAGIGRDFIKMMRQWYHGMRAMVVTPWGRSREVKIKRGVKQGSVLSPWLYSVYINGLIRRKKE